MAPDNRVLYIDNSNIFRGCKKSGWRPSYKRICGHLAEEAGPIQQVHFFASDKEVPRDKQAKFYQALKKDLGFRVHTFPLAQRKVSCPKCGNVEWVPTEKGVDVGLVTQFLVDFINRSFDTALVMSSDRDYLNAITAAVDGGVKVEIIAWKWTLLPETIRACKEREIPVLFLEDHRREFEKPQGDVL